MPLLQPHVESILKSAGSSGKSLFDASVLTSEVLGNVPEGLAVRPLHIADFDKGSDLLDFFMENSCSWKNIWETLQHFLYFGIQIIWLDPIPRNKRSDFSNLRYLDLLSQLTTVGPVTRDQFDERFHVMQRTQPSAYYVVVIEDERWWNAHLSGGFCAPHNILHLPILFQ